MSPDNVPLTEDIEMQTTALHDSEQASAPSSVELVDGSFRLTEVADLKDALKNELDAIRVLVNAVTLSAIVVIYTFVVRLENVAILGFQLPVTQVVLVAAPFLILGNWAIVIHLAKLRTILGEVPHSALPQAFSTLATHKWLLNPFSQYNVKRGSWLFGSIGYAGLVACWSLCITALSLVVLPHLSKQPLLVALVVVFLIAGLFTTGNIDRTFKLIRERMTFTDPRIAAALNQSIGARSWAKWAGGIAGVALGIFLAIYASVL